MQTQCGVREGHLISGPVRQFADLAVNLFCQTGSAGSILSLGQFQQQSAALLVVVTSAGGDQP